MRTVPVFLLGVGPTDGPTLLELADKLEACEGSLHGAAYQPVHLAVRVFRRLAGEIAYPKEVDAAAVQELIVELRKFSNTVANPACTRMLDAAATLERLIQAHEQPDSRPP